MILVSSSSMAFLFAWRWFSIPFRWMTMVSVMSFEEFFEHFLEVIKFSFFLIFIKDFFYFEEGMFMRNLMLTIFTKVVINTCWALISDSIDRIHVAGFANNSFVNKIWYDLRRFFSFKDFFFEYRKKIINSFINHLGYHLVEEAFHFFHMLFFVTRPISWAAMTSWMRSPHSFSPASWTLFSLFFCFDLSFLFFLWGLSFFSSNCLANLFLRWLRLNLY